PGTTVLDCVLEEHAGLERRLHEQADRLATAGNDELASATEAYEQAREAYERIGGDRLPQKASGMLDALGLPGRGGDFVGTLSGGEKNVLSLVRALLAEPELLLLDEPANHLDFDGLAWLEQFLQGFRGSVLIVSHNRYLLDRVAGGILHLDGGSVKAYAGNYSAYRATSLRERLNQGADYVANQKRLAQLEALVKRFEEFARRTADPAWGKRLRARRSQLERERKQAVERPADEASAMRPQTPTASSQADIALQLRGYSKAFGELRLLDGADLEVSCGERVALVGPNGSGKTTLVRDIVARGAWDDDTIRIGPSLRVGYCAQEQEVLDDSRTLFEELIADGTIKRDQANSVAARYLFREGDLDKRVGDLSGGERNRLQLAKVLAKDPSFLILDEPTNHLDIPAREAVEDVLTDYRGTVLLISHDRYFLDKVAGRVVEIRDRELVSYPMTFTEFWRDRRPAKGPARARVATRGRARAPRPAATTAARRTSPDRAPGELDRLIAEAEDEKLSLERRVAEAFTDGDYRMGSQIAKDLERHSARLNDLYAQWVREDT
ncbi:MAG: ABC-F family ATP-binding cassette domain-containing protein, partial [Dehalococcoidia bacterium]